ncbi:hypothetical protein FI615_002208 [Enterococcus faecium]|nr:hypothetical protein [Enterococcus faecium]EMF0115986.1 hypothetical protein [Enterococcus hirae]
MNVKREYWSLLLNNWLLTCTKINFLLFVFSEATIGWQDLNQEVISIYEHVVQPIVQMKVYVKVKWLPYAIVFNQILTEMKEYREKGEKDVSC